MRGLRSVGRYKPAEYACTGSGLNHPVNHFRRCRRDGFDADVKGIGAVAGVVSASGRGWDRGERVLFHNSNVLRLRSFIEAKHAAQPHATLDPLRLRSAHLRWRDQSIIETLMISLTVIMIRIFEQGAAEHRCAEGNDLGQALTFN